MTNSVAWAPLVHKFCSENITSHQNKPEFLREMAAIRSRWGKVQDEPGTVTATKVTFKRLGSQHEELPTAQSYAH